VRKTERSDMKTTEAMEEGEVGRGFRLEEQG
jgi:hypothetical protein